jgi:hypothetical protein
VRAKSRGAWEAAPDRKVLNIALPLILEKDTVSSKRKS